MNAVKMFWLDMGDYRSVSSRKEFWTGYLGNIAIIMVIYVIFSMMLGIVGGVLEVSEEGILILQVIAISLLLMVNLAFWIASLAAMTRRIRDAGFSPWWTVATVVPLVQIVPFIFLFFPTKNNGMNTGHNLG